MSIVAAWRKLTERSRKNRAEQANSLSIRPDMVEQARQEWLNAQNYYNNVCDRDLVDHAVYLTHAAERKYIYLLKKARQEGVFYPPYSD